VPPPAITFRAIKFGSPEFQKECKLRNEVLRLPLGLNLFDENLEQERHQMHFGLFDQDDNLLACVIAVANSSTEAKIRQMAVSPEHAEKGRGRSLLKFLEDFLARQAITHLSMHARMTAVGFYEKLGFERDGVEFVEVGIPHIRMVKHTITGH